MLVVASNSKDRCESGTVLLIKRQESENESFSKGLTQVGRSHIDIKSWETLIDLGRFLALKWSNESYATIFLKPISVNVCVISFHVSTRNPHLPLTCDPFLCSWSHFLYF